MSRDRNRPNVVILVFDALRADYVSAYGGDRIQTPNIDSVAEEGTLFENAFTTGPNTEISHAGLFSGQYPSETGIVGGSRSIPRDVPLLAEWFRDRGYDTYGISGPGKISSDFGYDRGFDRYVEAYYEELEPAISMDYLIEVLTDPLVARDAVRTLRTGQDQLTSLKFDLLERALGSNVDEPFLAFTNVTTVHDPYLPPRQYMARATPGLDRPRWYVLELLGSEYDIDDDEIRTDRVMAAARGRGTHYYADSGWLNEAELELLREWYAASLRYLDDQFGKFLDFLDRSGLAKNTVLLVTADHGEYLGEHGLLYHGYFHFDEVLQVPLLLRGPDVPAGERLEELASLVDVFDTLCDLCGLPSPETTSGHSLFEDETRDAVFAEYGIRNMERSLAGVPFPEEQRENFGLGRKCARTREAKLVVASDGTEQWYDLPAEREVDHGEVSRADRIRGSLEETLTTGFKPTPGYEDVNPNVKSNLQDLGYL